MADQLDILILGATGFTGMHCIPYVYKLCTSDDRKLTWGVAGRSEEKLKDVLKKMGKKIDADLSNVPVISCDIQNHDSLLKMAERTKLVINCCGPFTFLGEAVVQACIESGTHHIDVSGEPQYIETVQLKYDKPAKEKGVYVVSACGVDSIPADLGIVYLQKQFEGVLNSATTYLEVGGKSNSGPVINYGTWSSIVHSLAQKNELRELKKQLFSGMDPKFRPKLKPKFFPHKPEVVDGWALPFMGSDRAIARRTQRYLYEHENQRPAQIDTLFIVKSFFHVLAFLFLGGILILFTKFKFGQKLLLDYPQIFTFGMISKEQPSEEAIENSWFNLYLHGEGWQEKLANKDDNYADPPNKRIFGKVHGTNPGYGSTCICLTGAAFMILNEKSKLPGAEKGGVYTPGIAFGKTSLIDWLHKNGVTFEIISKKDV